VSAPPRQIVLPLLALALQAGGLLALHALYTASYSSPPGAIAAYERPLTYALLALAGFGAGLSALAGVFYLLTRSRLRVALPMLLLLSLPTLLISATISYALLIAIPAI
jgi:hypothetical protein